MPHPPGAPAPHRAAVRDAASYVGLMGLGMAAMHLGLGIRYGEPRMMMALLPVEVVLSLWAAFAARRQGGLAAAGLDLVRPRRVVWILPLALPVLAGLFALGQVVLQAPLPEGKGSLLAAAAATTALVGFSEELMFRGVLLRGTWRGAGTYRAMLVSSVGFMLLHAVNVLGGSPPGIVALQLASTFLFGLSAAPVAVRLGTLWPLMLVHWGWDLMLFGHGTLGAAPPVAALLLLPTQVLVAASGWWSLRGERGRRLGEAEGGATA